MSLLRRDNSDMNSFALNDLIIMYGFLAVFVCLGIVFLIVGYVNRKKFLQSRSNLSTGVSFGGPKQLLEGDRKALFLSKTFIKLGIIFAGIGILGIIVITLTR